MVAIPTEIDPVFCRNTRARKKRSASEMIVFFIIAATYAADALRVGFLVNRSFDRLFVCVLYMPD